MKNSKHLLVSVVGPTAVGKTSFAIELARTFETEIISADSRQCYRELTIGTAKASQRELATVKHHFIDSHSIHEWVSAGQFAQLALDRLESLFGNKEVVVAVGGSGLYFQALWGGLDEIPKVDESFRIELNDEYAEKGIEHLLEELKNADPTYYEQVDSKNPQRILRALEVIRGTGKSYSSFRKERTAERPFQNLKIGLTLDRKVLYQRIDHRMDQMIESGLFEEAEALIKFRNQNALQTVGYSEIFGYLDGSYDKDEAIRLLKRNSRRYAKRQLTWFNRDLEINWMDPRELEKAIGLVKERLSI